jgi:hypothetical protein
VVGVGTEPTSCLPGFAQERARGRAVLSAGRSHRAGQKQRAVDRQHRPVRHAEVAAEHRGGTLDQLHGGPEPAGGQQGVGDGPEQRVEQLEQASAAIATQIVQAAGVDVSSVALDMTNFASFIDSANSRAPIAQRGKAKQKRCDLRLVGLGLVVTRDGGIPLTWHAYPGDKPDVTQFPKMITQLRGQYEAVCAAAGPWKPPPSLTRTSPSPPTSSACSPHPCSRRR